MDQIKPGAPSALEEHPLRIQEASPQGRATITMNSVTTTSTASIAEHKSPFPETTVRGLLSWITGSPGEGNFTTAQRPTTHTVPYGI